MSCRKNFYIIHYCFEEQKIMNKNKKFLTNTYIYKYIYFLIFDRMSTHLLNGNNIMNLFKIRVERNKPLTSKFKLHYLM